MINIEKENSNIGNLTNIKNAQTVKDLESLLGDSEFYKHIS